MSSASIASPSCSAIPRVSTTVKQFGRAWAVVVTAVVVGCALYGLETFVLRPPRRFLENPTDGMMRSLGLAHFIVGWLFLLTSPRMRSARTLAQLAAAVLVGAGLCGLFSACGAWRDPLALAGFYGYFLIHEVRDEMHLFQVYGDAPAAAAVERRLRDRLNWGVAVLLMGLLAAGFVLHPHSGKKLDSLQNVHPAALAAGVALLLATGAVFLASAHRAGRQVFGRGAAWLRAYQPILVVYAGLAALVLMIPAAGSVGFNLLILLHVASWLVFVARQLGERTQAGQGTSGPWWRSTAAGFVTLHLGLAALVLAWMAARVYLWERTGLLSELVAGSSFPYWSVMHITIAFVKPR